MPAIAHSIGLDTDGYTMDSKPTLLMIPCFAGAPWQLDQLDHLQGWPIRTMRLPERLSRISVPTLILTPDDNRLVGKDAAGILLGGIRRSREVILPRTGHMFRFSHPSRYSKAVHTFLQSTIPAMGGAQ
jgi:pimeloyl-ACP methyl ester carboxylesterase